MRLQGILCLTMLGQSLRRDRQKNKNKKLTKEINEIRMLPGECFFLGSLLDSGVPLNQGESESKKKDTREHNSRMLFGAMLISHYSYYWTLIE